MRKLARGLTSCAQGTSILKELIQNADDARATTVRFLLDCRQHTTGECVRTTRVEYAPLPFASYE
jgi:hypothetical protein